MNKRAYKANLRIEERLRKDILKLAGRIRSYADGFEAKLKGVSVEPGIYGGPHHSVAELRRLADQCERLAPLIGFHHGLPKPGGRALLMAYAAQVTREANPGISRQKIANALSPENEYLDADTIRKAEERTKKQLGPDALTKSSPLRNILDQHLAPKKR